MRFIFVIVLIINCITSISQNNKHYTLELDIQTSFQGSRIWNIERDQDYCVLDSVKYPFKKKDSLLIDYFEQLDTILDKYKFYHLSSNVYKNGKETGSWLDGTMTYGKLILPDTIKTFDFHSGNINYDTLQIELIDVFFNLARYLYSQENINRNLDNPNMEYLEKIENEVGRTPIRQVSVNPLHYRLFDVIYNFNYTTVCRLFENMPLDRPVLVEVGRHADMNVNSKFVSFLKGYFKTRRNIYWIVPYDKKAKIMELGLKNEYILDNMDDFEKIQKSMKASKL